MTSTTLALHYSCLSIALTALFHSLILNFPLLCNAAQSTLIISYSSNHSFSSLNLTSLGLSD